MVRAQGKWVFVILLAMGFFCWRSFQSEGSSTARTLEDYWQETGLELSELEELLQPQLCSSSERYFLSCANAVVSMAQRFSLQIHPPSQIVPLGGKDELYESEKLQLSSWKKFYRQHHNNKEALQISFIGIARNLIDRVKNKNHEPFYVGMGFNGFLSVFKDPHTYLTPMKYYQDVTSKPDGKTFSLGITLGREKDGYFLRKIQPRSIADETGLRRGDKILKINEKNVAALGLNQVLELLRSEPSQNIQLTVLRKDKSINFQLKRRMNTNEAITSQVLPGKRKLGLLTISRFTYETCEITKKKVQSLIKDGIRGLLVDLRDNPGGLVEEAACTASLFVGPRKMFVLKYLEVDKEEEIFYGDQEKIFSAPLAVLINSETASSAELFAGILRDYNRGVIVGERSFGKGSFQEGDTWFKNSSLALFQTQGLFYLPSGDSPQAVGIEPDIEIRGKSAFQEREAQMFLYPLQASRPTASHGRKKMNLASCGDKGGSLEDPELLKAQLALSCASMGSSSANTTDYEGLHDSNGSF